MAKSSLIGRAPEREVLTEMLRSGRAELLALYGRRRIGKTFLVRKFFEEIGGTYLEVTGTKDGSAVIQRGRFRDAVQRAFVPGQLLPQPASWDDALSYLADLVEQRAAARPKEAIVLFFDELPWLATARSRLLESIDYYWNSRLSKIPQVKLILCGSAASWMLRRIVHAKGGLHNRITRRMRLEPFSLREASELLRARKVKLGQRETLELYMALGGVPYYLSLVERGRSVAETVGALCFEKSGPLRGEFDNVFSSLFENHEEHVAVVRALAGRSTGLTRNELIEDTSLGSGGGLNRRLEELEEAGFVGRVDPYGAKVKNTVFRVIDEHTLFHLKWIERAPKGVLARGAAAYWQSRAQTPSYRAWAGYAFENICLKHAAELQRALGIEGLVTEVGTWRYVPRARSPERAGAQVDLLFERNDDVLHLCEIKFGHEPFVVTKAYARALKEKISVFERRSQTRKRIIVTLIAAEGLKPNAWSEDLIDRTVDATALIG